MGKDSADIDSASVTSSKETAVTSKVSLEVIDVSNDDKVEEPEDNCVKEDFSAQHGQ